MLAFTPRHLYNDKMSKTSVVVKKEMALPDGRTVTTHFEVNSDAVLVRVEGWDMVPLPWDTMTDVEQLSILFGDHIVLVFKQVVEQLGIIYSNRSLYEALA